MKTKEYIALSFGVTSLKETPRYVVWMVGWYADPRVLGAFTSGQ